MRATIFRFCRQKSEKSNFFEFQKQRNGAKKNKERERDRKNNGRARASLRKLFQLLAATVAAKRWSLSLSLSLSPLSPSLSHLPPSLSLSLSVPDLFAHRTTECFEFEPMRSFRQCFEDRHVSESNHPFQFFNLEVGWKQNNLKTSLTTTTATATSTTTTSSVTFMSCDHWNIANKLQRKKQHF